MKIDRDLADAIYRTDFGAFTYRAFEALNPGQRLIPNWHIETVMQMREQIIGLAAQWQVDLVIVEDTSSGMGLMQLLKEVPRLDVVGRQPDTDKVTRMSRQQARFEAGRILLPTEALWLADFENELLAFPSGRYDDQVDALLLFLDWFAQNEQYLQPIIFCPPILVPQSEPWPWPVDPWPFERSG
jgi:predicted phage terminase large subunit-like protein